MRSAQARSLRRLRRARPKGIARPIRNLAARSIGPGRRLAVPLLEKYVNQVCSPPDRRRCGGGALLCGPTGAAGRSNSD